MNLFIKITLGMLFVLLGQSCSKISHPVRIPYEQAQAAIPRQTLNNWQDWFAQSPKIDSFKVLNTGSVKVPIKGMLNKQKLPLDHGFEKHIWVDVFVFLFHHEESGWYMIDTGLDSSFQDKGNISGLLAGNYIKASKQKVGQNIAAQLKREQKTIQGIFLTHLHGDHTAGLAEINSSIPKYLAKGEAHIHIPILYHSNHLDSHDTLQEINWEKGSPLFPFESVVDIFGDRSLLGIHTPGHSKSHMSYLLQTDQGAILLTGDASHTKYGFVNNIEPGWVDQQSTAENSLKQLRTFKKMFPETWVIYGHER